MSITEANRASTAGDARAPAADRLSAEVEPPTNGGAAEPRPATGDPRLDPGTPVEVRSTLEHRWSKGFEVVEATESGYRVRRLSDNADLPGVIRAADVRKEKRRGTWWY